MIAIFSILSMKSGEDMVDPIDYFVGCFPIDKPPHRYKYEAEEK